MSMETLAADLKANIAEAAKLSGLSSMEEVTRHLKDVLWPTLEAVVEEMKEIDGCVADMVHGAPEMLHPESGEVFAGVIAGAVAVSAALKQRITREAEPALYKVIDELEANCVEANGILEDIVLEEVDDDDDDDEDEDEDGEGDDLEEGDDSEH